jgi:hypothetical protein
VKEQTVMGTPSIPPRVEPAPLIAEGELTRREAARRAERRERAHLLALRRDRRRRAAEGRYLPPLPPALRKLENEERRTRNARRRAKLMLTNPVPADRVPRSVRWAAEQMLRHVRADLGLPPTLTLQWFRPRLGVPRGLGVAASTGGFFRPSDPDRLWLRVRRGLADAAAYVVAHEARHAWQHREGWKPRDKRKEPDAEAYAKTKSGLACAFGWPSAGDRREVLGLALGVVGVRSRYVSNAQKVPIECLTDVAFEQIAADLDATGQPDDRAHAIELRLVQALRRAAVADVAAAQACPPETVLARLLAQDRATRRTVMAALYARYRPQDKAGR